MRVYIKSLCLFMLPEAELKPYYLSTSHEELIYSTEGIYKYTNNKLKKLFIKDEVVTED